MNMMKIKRYKEIGEIETFYEIFDFHEPNPIQIPSFHKDPRNLIKRGLGLDDWQIDVTWDDFAVIEARIHIPNMGRNREKTVEVLHSLGFGLACSSSYLEEGKEWLILDFEIENYGGEEKRFFQGMERLREELENKKQNDKI